MAGANARELFGGGRREDHAQRILKKCWRKPPTASATGDVVNEALDPRSTRPDGFA